MSRVSHAVDRIEVIFDDETFVADAVLPSRAAGSMRQRPADAFAGKLAGTRHLADAAG